MRTKSLLAILLILGISVSLVSLKASAVNAGNLSVVAEFNPALGELAGGLAFDPTGNAYVGMALTGEIKKVTRDGIVSTFASLPVPQWPAGVMLGMVFDRGYFYVAVNNFLNPAQHGIWKVSLTGQASMFAPLPLDEPSLYNEPIVDKSGNFYVTDSFGGKVLKVDRNGNSSVFLQDSLLAPDPNAFLQIGADGLALDEDQEKLYVTNNNYGRIVRVPIKDDGSAGNVSVFVENLTILGGADGLTFDNNGNLFCAIVNDRLVSIDKNANISTLAEGEPLQFPATVAFGSHPMQKNTLYITNLSFIPSWGLYPALLKLEIY